MIVTNRMLSILNYVMHSSVRLHINDLANLYAVSHRVIYYDLEMLQTSGQSYVTANAFPELKKYIPNVIPSNAEFGVIKKIKELL